MISDMPKTFLKRPINDPYLPVVNYRIGNYLTFRQNMINAISNKKWTTLSRWTNRTEKDWGLVMMDMWAYLADILTYYQEQIMNESFFGTAVLDESIIELMYNINHKPIPGISASSLAQFEASEKSPGTISKNFKLQSVITEENDQSVIFETDEAVYVASDANLMILDGSKIKENIEEGTTSLSLDKIYNILNVGDFILITDNINETIVQITEKKDYNNHTEISWQSEHALTKTYDIRRTKMYKLTKPLYSFGHDTPPPSFGTIKGNIAENIKPLTGKGERDQPLVQVKIELLDAGGNLVASTESDKNGNFSFRRILPGPYMFRIKRTDDFRMLSRWKTIKSSIFQVFPSHEIKIDAVAHSVEFLSQSDIEYRHKLEVATKSSDMWDMIGQSLLSSVIYLDNKVSDIKPNSPLVLVNEQTPAPFNRETQLFRVKEVENETHLEYGIRKDVTKLMLVSFSGESLIEHAFCWDDIPEEPEATRSTFWRKLKTYMTSKNGPVTKFKKGLTQAADSEIKNVTKQAQQEIGTVQKEINAEDKALQKDLPSPVIPQIKKIPSIPKIQTQKQVDNLLEHLKKEETGESGLEGLRSFMRDKLGLEWIDEIPNENIMRDGKENIIQIAGEEHYAIIELNEKKTAARMTLDGQKSYDLTVVVEKETNRLNLYWDTVQKSDFNVRTSKIIVNPTFELKTEAQIPSLEKTYKENNLILEGTHASIKTGSFLSITDNTNKIKGQLLDRNNRSLYDYQIKICQEVRKKDKTIFKNILQRPNLTDENGNFEFNYIVKGTYLIGAYLSPLSFWEQYLAYNMPESNELMQKVKRIVIGESKQTKNRAITTSIRIMAALVREIADIIEKERKKIDFIEVEIHSALKELLRSAIDLVLPLSKLKDQLGDLQKIDLKDDESRNKLIDLILNNSIQKLTEAIDDMKHKTQTFQDIVIHNKVSDIMLILTNIVRYIFTAIDAMKESSKSIEKTLRNSINEDELNDYCIGITEKLAIERNNLLKITMIADDSGYLQYSIAVSESKNQEIARVFDIAFKSDKTYVTTELPLVHHYLKGYCEIRSNIVSVSHGQSVKKEILGSGDASLPFQKFTLEKGPLTFTSSSINPTEVESSLEVLVNDVRWEEKEDFLDSKPSDRHYITSINEEEKIVVTFGDGLHGSRVPTGIDNVIASYRVGLGPSGNIRPNTLTTLVDTNPAVKSVTNPIPASGGYRETPVQQKPWAIAAVKSLGKAVSLEDYANLALTTSYVVRAKAFQIIENGMKTIKLMVVPTGGVILDDIQKTKLRKFLDKRRNQNVPLRIESFNKVPIDVVMEITIEENYIKEKVVNDLDVALKPGKVRDGKYSFFSFESLSSKDGLSLSDVYNTIGEIEGIKYANVKKFKRRDYDKEVEDHIDVGDAEILQCEDDPLDPEKGTLKIITLGGIEL